MDLILLNQREEPIGHIPARNVVRRRVHGNFDILEFDTTFKGIEKRFRVLAQMPTLEWQEFIVSTIEETSGNLSVTCEHSIYETSGEFISDRSPTQTADICLDVALDFSRWKRSKSLNFTTEPTRVDFYRCSVRKAISIIEETFNVIVRTNVTVSGYSIISRNIWLENPYGENKGYRYVAGRNAANVVRKVEDQEVITCLYGYGKGPYIPETGGYGRAIDFSSVNDGVSFVENVEATAHYGRRIFGKVEYPEIEDPLLLLLLTTVDLMKRTEPKVSYSGTVTDINIGDSVDIGDRVLLIDDSISVRVEGQVLEMVDFLDKSSDNSITIGNYQTEHPEVTRSKVISELKSILFSDPTRGALQETVSGQIESLISNWNTQMNNGLMDGKITTLPGGFIFEDANGATHIGPSGTRVANTKNPDGSWNFTSLFNGSGMGAEVIAGENIKAGSVESDHISATGISASKIRLRDEVSLDDKVDTINGAVKTIVTEYYPSTDISEPTGGEWTTTIPDQLDGIYIFTRSLITKIDDSWYYTPSVNISGSDGKSAYHVEIISDSGHIFKNGIINTQLRAILYYGDIDVTDITDANRFKWTRVSYDVVGDSLWNSQHAGGSKNILVSSEDINKRATFFCEVSNN